jgi:hypothetical protein
VLAAFTHPMTAMPGIPDNHLRIRFSACKVINFSQENGDNYCILWRRLLHFMTAIIAFGNRIYCI